MKKNEKICVVGLGYTCLSTVIHKEFKNLGVKINFDFSGMTNK